VPTRNRPDDGNRLASRTTKNLLVYVKLCVSTVSALFAARYKVSDVSRANGKFDKAPVE
jgi:hypothetical protein